MVALVVTLDVTLTEVLTATGPSIEDSTDLRFCAWQATYPELQSQLDKSG